MRGTQWVKITNFLKKGVSLAHLKAGGAKHPSLEAVGLFDNQASICAKIHKLLMVNPDISPM